MGNGASATQIVVDGKPVSMANVKSMLPELKHQLKLKDTAIHVCQQELEETKRLLKNKDVEIVKLKEEVNKLKSVLQLTVHKGELKNVRVGKLDILSTIQEQPAVLGQTGRSKKQGVSGESSASGLGTVKLDRHEKDFR